MASYIMPLHPSFYFQFGSSSTDIDGPKLRQEREAVATASLPSGAPLGAEAAREGTAQEARPVAGAKGVPGGSPGIPGACPAADGGDPFDCPTTTPAAAEGHCSAAAWSAQVGSSGDVRWRRSL